MFKRFNVLLALALWISCGNPAMAAPQLSAHSPTLSAASSPVSRVPLSRVLFGLAAVAGVAITVKDSASSATKFVNRAAGAAQDYANGVAGAGQKWQANATAAEPNYKAGVQDAANRGAYGKGIAKHGSQKYQDNASKLGTQRYPTGVQNAQGAYQRGVDPYLQVLKGLDLPLRGPKGSPQNQNRAAAVAIALRKAKVGG